MKFILIIQNTFKNYKMRQYNILSNYTITKHHYDKPENRTKIIDDVLNKSIKLKKVFLNNNKDYDIIINKYKIFNKEKKETDLEIINTHLQKILQIKRGRFYYLLNKKNMN